jgi:hypothetical protein
VWQITRKQGFVEGVTLRRVHYIPAGTAWGGTFVLHPEPDRYQGGRHYVQVKASVQGGGRSRDLSYDIYVRPEEFASEADFLAHVLQRVCAGMEYKKNQRGDQQLRVLRVGYTEG